MMNEIGWGEAIEQVARNLEAMRSDQLGAMLSTCNRLIRTGDEQEKQVGEILKEQVLEAFRRRRELVSYCCAGCDQNIDVPFDADECPACGGTLSGNGLPIT